MQKLIGLLIILLTTSLGIVAQTDKTEISRLRQELNLPDTIPIIADSKSDFPVSKPVKIFLLIKHNKSFAKSFVKWVEDWNKKDANKFGKLEIVSKIDDADVVATQFRYGVKKYVETTRVRTSTGKIQRDDDETFTGQSIGNSKVRVESGYEGLNFPLYSYLLVRGDQNSWILNFWFVDDGIDRLKTNPEARLQGQIESQMKKR